MNPGLNPGQINPGFNPPGGNIPGGEFPAVPHDVPGQGIPHAQNPVQNAPDANAPVFQFQQQPQAQQRDNALTFILLGVLGSITLIGIITLAVIKGLGGI
jgi:hypothetical protein